MPLKRRKLCVVFLFVMLVNCARVGADTGQTEKSQRLLLDEGNGRKLEHERQILMEVNKQLQDQQDAAKKALEELVRIDAMKEKAEKKSSRLRSYFIIERLQYF